MKADIHPKYYEKAVVTCSCGAKHKVSSTREEMTVEICSECHPFYTGKEKLVDTAGRVEKFKSRRAKAEKAAAKKTTGRKPAPKKSSAAKGQATKGTAAKKATIKKK